MEASTITPDNAERVIKALAHGVPAAELAMAPRAADGIDALLTTPALLRELRCVSEELPPGTSRQAQADHVWLQLFVHRTPLSDPCRRVLTLFNKLGFRDHVQTRSLGKMHPFCQALQYASNTDLINHFGQLPCTNRTHQRGLFGVYIQQTLNTVIVRLATT